MTNVELVIKLDHYAYRDVIAHGGNSEKLVDAVRKGTLLPKGHGRLIDADYITKDFNTFQDSFCINLLDMGRGRLNVVCTAPTIIGADKEENE